MYLIYSTAPNILEAKKIARTLVEQKLAACVNIVGGVESLYEWQGEIETAQEVLLLIKAFDFAKVEAKIKELHSYEVPEIVAVEVARASQEYREWMEQVLLQ